MSNQTHIKRAFSLFRFGKFEIPESPESENYLVEKMLWKLGFDVPLYPPHQMLFWKRHAKLIEVARTYVDYTETDKEEIRSAAVNLFVSLEEVLDNSLSFCTWMLFSDHYGETGFKCDLDESRRLMASRLHGRIPNPNNYQESLDINPEGVNTLYPLIQGFRALSILCRDTIASPPTEARRPQAEFPGYHSRSDIQLFPFPNKLFLLDMRKEDQITILEQLNDITSTLDQAQVSNIRNRLEHKRKEHEFPCQLEIEVACTAIAKVVTNMEKLGICPLIYLFSGETTDQSLRTITKVSDYRDRDIIFNEPSPYSMAKLPSLHQPLIVVPSIRIGLSSDVVRFAFKENSAYANLWRNYPKRKLRIFEETK